MCTVLLFIAGWRLAAFAILGWLLMIGLAGSALGSLSSVADPAGGEGLLVRDGSQMPSAPT